MCSSGVDITVALLTKYNVKKFDFVLFIAISYTLLKNSNVKNSMSYSSLNFGVHC